MNGRSVWILQQEQRVERPWTQCLSSGALRIRPLTEALPAEPFILQDVSEFLTSVPR